MRQILADYTASIFELKKNPSALILEAHGAPIAVLNHNIPRLRTIFLRGF